MHWTCYQRSDGKLGYQVICNPELHAREKNPYDEIFFRTIRELNDQRRVGESIVIQVSDDEAMLVYWNKSHWERAIYPFKKELAIK